MKEKFVDESHVVTGVVEYGEARMASEMEVLFDRLWPLMRSITGPGVRQTHEILAELVSLSTFEVPSGTQVLDWTVPPEWSVREAYITTPDGNRILDIKGNNLHLVNYSCPIRATMRKAELVPHLYSLPEKPDAIPLPDKKKKQKKIETKKQNPKKIKTEIKQTSEFEKKELFDPDKIAALIDKSKIKTAETTHKSNKITQSQEKNSLTSSLTLSEEDALKSQIFGCWSIPLGLPYNDNLLVRIKLKLEPDGTVIKSEILDHARMNIPGQGFYKVLAESALRAIRLCQPLRVPTTGYDRWKDLQLNFDANEMLKG